MSGNKLRQVPMAKYLSRSCPRCNGYVGIVLREPGRNTALQAVNGHCLGCGYRLAWIVIRGRRSLLSVAPTRKPANAKKGP
jgi:hypothetical protein